MVQRERERERGLNHPEARPHRGKKARGTCGMWRPARVNTRGQVPDERTSFGEACSRRLAIGQLRLCSVSKSQEPAFAGYTYACTSFSAPDHRGTVRAASGTLGWKLRALCNERLMEAHFVFASLGVPCSFSLSCSFSAGVFVFVFV